MTKITQQTLLLLNLH